MIVFFCTDPTSTHIFTLSLHDALPICCRHCSRAVSGLLNLRPGACFTAASRCVGPFAGAHLIHHEVHLHVPVDFMMYEIDRKSTRLNSSHSQISYAVFCLKKKRRRCYS